MGQGEVGEFTYRVRKAWPCLGSAAVGGPLLSSSTQIGLENTSSGPVGTPFLPIKLLLSL